MQTSEIIIGLVGAGVLGGLYYFGKEIGSLNASIKNLILRMDNLSCHKNDGHCTNVNTLSQKIDTISDDVKQIQFDIIRMSVNKKGKFSVRCCPYQLTESGLMLLEDSRGKKCIDENLEFFIHEIKNKNPKVALDVENNALLVLSRNIDMDFFNEIKNFVFIAPCPYIST